MKTLTKLTAIALLLMSSTALRADLADMVALAIYADQLQNQGVRGPQFTQLVDQRYVMLYPDYRYQGNGMGGFVQQMHARGLYGKALANAIHAEQQRRGIGMGRGNAGIPPGQLKKTGIGLFGPGKVKPGKPNTGLFNFLGKNKPKDKPASFSTGKGKHKK
ncbi:hypothetical protein [Prosthecobacter sp.]|uniref:hypothetical protein n=1 Tax=Prosthecobacter sp. TaxID=1965333 RepID=UPI002AB818B1|nr:hypothetical protein [Prosthecobacter sp.]MDZ4404668.1 hypothetical protein [Prosthecobacter sp.]